MKKFEFEMSITAPTENEAIRKMKALQGLGKHLNLDDLETMERTVSNPTMLAIVKQKLGLN